MPTLGHPNSCYLPPSPPLLHELPRTTPSRFHTPPASLANLDVRSCAKIYSHCSDAPPARGRCHLFAAQRLLPLHLPHDNATRTSGPINENPHDEFRLKINPSTLRYADPNPHTPGSKFNAFDADARVSEIHLPELTPPSMANARSSSPPSQCVATPASLILLASLAVIS